MSKNKNDVNCDAAVGSVRLCANLSLHLRQQDVLEQAIEPLLKKESADPKPHAAASGQHRHDN